MHGNSGAITSVKIIYLLVAVLIPIHVFSLFALAAKQGSHSPHKILLHICYLRPAILGNLKSNFSADDIDNLNLNLRYSPYLSLIVVIANKPAPIQMWITYHSIL